MQYNHFGGQFGGLLQNVTDEQFGGLLQKRFQIFRSHAPNNFQKQEGVYILSQRSNPTVQPDSRMKVKIGRSNNLYNRLDSYHTSYPDSFYTYSVIITKEGKAKALEKAIHDDLKSLYVNYLYVNRDYQARNEGEWFYVRKRRLLQILRLNILRFQDDIKVLWNDHEGFQLQRPENNRTIKVHNTALEEEQPVAPRERVRREPRPRNTETRTGYAIDETGNYKRVERPPDETWRKDWQQPDATLTRASRNRRPPERLNP